MKRSLLGVRAARMSSVKLKHLPQMTPEDKAAFKAKMNATYPDVKVAVPGGPAIGPYRG